MIEFAPFMLFILGLDTDNPNGVEFERVAVVYATLAQCEEAGQVISKRRSKEAEDTTKASYQYRCIPLPKGEEIERAFREWDGQGA